MSSRRVRKRTPGTTGYSATPQSLGWKPFPGTWRTEKQKQSASFHHREVKLDQPDELLWWNEQPDGWGESSRYCLPGLQQGLWHCHPEESQTSCWCVGWMSSKVDWNWLNSQDQRVVNSGTKPSWRPDFRSQKERTHQNNASSTLAHFWQASGTFKGWVCMTVRSFQLL